MTIMMVSNAGDEFRFNDNFLFRAAITNTGGIGALPASEALYYFAARVRLLKKRICITNEHGIITNLEFLDQGMIEP